jgi:hypothetical protein
VEDTSSKDQKNTVISTLGDIYERSGAPALVKLLTTVDPSFTAAGAIGDLLVYGSSERAKCKNAYFAAKLEEQLKENTENIKRIEESLYEAVVLAIQGVQTAVSKDKIDRFAKIVAGHAERKSSWEETATALRAISTLEDIHIDILSTAARYPRDNDKEARFFVRTPRFRGSPFLNGKAVVEPELEILGALEERTCTEITMYCMELMAKGFLHDNDQGQFDKGPVFTLTDAAYWLLVKIELISGSLDK